jgi:hypothetical protein
MRIEDDNLHVKMGWGFEATIPLSSITNAKPSTEKMVGLGVHGWRGRWLVNGSSKGVVELTIDPPVKARVTGMPVTLRTLLLSVTDPGALIAAVTQPA